MRQTFWAVGVLLLLSPVLGYAQGAAPVLPPTDVTTAEIQAGLKRALEELKPGVSVSDHLISLADIGKYNVGVAVVARPAGTFKNSLTHDKINNLLVLVVDLWSLVFGHWATND